MIELNDLQKAAQKKVERTKRNRSRINVWSRTKTQWQEQKAKQLMNGNHKAKTNRKLLKAKNGKTKKEKSGEFWFVSNTCCSYTAIDEGTLNTHLKLAFFLDSFTFIIQLLEGLVTARWNRSSFSYHFCLGRPWLARNDIFFQIGRLLDGNWYGRKLGYFVRYSFLSNWMKIVP